MVQHEYAYARQYTAKLYLMLNGTDEATTLPLKYYKEILKDHAQGKDILTGRIINLDGERRVLKRMVIEIFP